MPLGMEVGLGPGNFVLDGDAPSLPKKGAEPPPQFSAHVYCGQTTGWIKMALGRDMGLGPGHIVLDGEHPLLKKGHSPPIFGIFLLWPNGWMHQDATWYGGRPQPKQLCVRWGPSPLPKTGGAPNFRLMFIAAKRLDGSRCHLSYCHLASSAVVMQTCVNMLESSETILAGRNRSKRGLLHCSYLWFYSSCLNNSVK